MEFFLKQVIPVLHIVFAMLNKQKDSEKPFLRIGILLPSSKQPHPQTHRHHAKILPGTLIAVKDIDIGQPRHPFLIV